MAAERLVRGPVHREDGQAKTFVKICFTLQVPEYLGYSISVRYMYNKVKE